MALWKTGGFAEDAYVAVGETDPLPDGPGPRSPQALPRRARKTSRQRDAPVGVIVQPSDTLDALLADLPTLPVLALAFPKFGDGRAFSLARLARERHGFAGELRAVGDILFDRIAYMLRCGFDSLDIANEPTLEALRAGRVPVSHERYQPTGGDSSKPDPTKPWRQA